MRYALVGATSILFLGAASAAPLPTAPGGAVVNGRPQETVPTVLLNPNGTIATPGQTVASVTPTPLTPTTIAATNTYQQAFPAGAATTAGGVLQASSSNAAAVCLDLSSAAVAGATTLTGGQVCAQPGTAISFPATAGAGFVYGTKGDTFSGSAS